MRYFFQVILVDNLTEIGQISDLGYLGFTGSLMHGAIKRSNVSAQRSYLLFPQLV